MRQQDDTAIRALEDAYDAAWNAGDIPALVALFVPDAVVINPTGNRAKGQGEIGRVLGEFLAGSAMGSRHTTLVLGIEFLTDDVAVVDGEARLEGLSDIEGHSASPLVHRFTDVMVRKGGTWLIAQVRAYFFGTASPQ